MANFVFGGYAISFLIDNSILFFDDLNIYLSLRWANECTDFQGEIYLLCNQCTCKDNLSETVIKFSRYWFQDIMT